MSGSWIGGTGDSVEVKGMAPSEAESSAVLVPGSVISQRNVTGLEVLLSFLSYLSSSQLFSLFDNALYSLIVEFLRNKL